MKNLKYFFYIITLLYWFAATSSAYCQDSTNVILSWNANSDADLAGYKVYYGTKTRSYTSVINVGNVTEYLIRLDNSLRYYLAVTAYDIAGNESGFSLEASTIGITSVEDVNILPEYYSLHAFPNPFNPGCTIRITISKLSTSASIRIFNVKGQQVYLHYITQAGKIEIHWQPGSLPTGVYYAILNNGTFFKTKRLTYLK